MLETWGADAGCDGIDGWIRAPGLTGLLWSLYDDEIGMVFLRPLWLANICHSVFTQLNINKGGLAM